jgi:hypothetical protein
MATSSPAAVTLTSPFAFEMTNSVAERLARRGRGRRENRQRRDDG